MKPYACLFLSLVRFASSVYAHLMFQLQLRYLDGHLGVCVCVYVCVSVIFCECVIFLYQLCDSVCVHIYAVWIERWFFYRTRWLLTVHLLCFSSSFFEYLIYSFLTHTHRCFHYLSVHYKQNLHSIVVVNNREPHKIKTK